MRQTIKEWWSSSARNLVYIRWGALVLANILFPLFLATLVLHNSAQYIGVLLAVATFIAIYAELDLWLLSKQHIRLAKQLRVSAAIKIGSPLLPIIDLFVGAISIEATKIMTGYDLERTTIQTDSPDRLHGALPHFSTAENIAAAYITTIINGLLLSVVVAFILLLVRLIQKLWHNRKALSS